MRRFFYGMLISFLAAGLFAPRIISAESILHITTEDGVSIWLNEKLMGKTSKKENGLVIRNLDAGEYHLRAARQGYNGAETWLTVEDNQVIEWRIHFVKPEMTVDTAVRRIETSMVESKPVGTIILRSVPLNAEVFFNGKSIGGADRKIRYAPAGDYTVKFIFQGQELSETFSLETGATSIVAADFTRGEISSEIIEGQNELGPAEINMQTARKKKPAMFPHRKHQGMYGCEVCHHGMDAEGNQTPYTEGIKIQHCVTCHNPTMENEKLNSLMQVAHTKCKGCHKQVVEESGTAGPIGKCSGCHNVPEEE